MDSAIIVRLPKALHGRLKTAAEKAGRSLNRHCVALLSGESAPSGAGRTSASVELDVTSEIRDLVYGVKGDLDEDLEGLVLFGSYARGTTTPSSDVDLLIVLRPPVAVDRDIYSRWLPRHVEGREVSPLFVSLPDPSAELRGIWLEIALDGIVLFDRSLLVSRYLAAVRQAVVDGRVRRMTSHGHPYWVHVHSQKEKSSIV